MNSRITLAIAVLALAIANNPVRADWALSAQELRTIEQAYPAGQAAERAGKMAEALAHYMTAQSYTGQPNPNASKAAQRSAQIAPALASAEEKKGNHTQAAALYDQGGLFALGDRALLASLRTNLDEPAAVARLLKHFDERASDSFKLIHKLRLEAAGPYTPDAGLVQEVRTALAKGPERALQREAVAFDAQFLKERVALVQARPEPHQFEAMKATIDRERAFVQKWPDDVLKKSFDELNRLRDWSQVERDLTVQSSIEARLLRRAEERAGTLLASYSGAPEFLQTAQDYYNFAHYLKPAEPRIASIHALAVRLGGEAEGKGQLTLAASYFSIAGDRAKGQALRQRQQQLVQQKIQPEIDAGQRVAQSLREQFADPAKIEALRKQAQAAQAAAATQRAAAERPGRSADDLQKALGMK